MPESKKEAYNRAAFKTIKQFKTMYNIGKADDQVVSDAVHAIYKRNTKVNNPTGKPIPVVSRKSRSHNGDSAFLICPMGHDIILEEIEKHKKLAAKKAKGAEK